jgi:hypothetical protein
MGIAVLLCKQTIFVPHKKHVFTTCYVDSFTCLYVDVVVPHRKYTYGLPLSGTGVALHFYMQMIVPNRKHMYEPPRPVTGIALLYFMSEVPENP